jgi:hypothetical protein
MAIRHDAGGIRRLYAELHIIVTGKIGRQR